MVVPLCRCRVLYIGSAVPTVTKDGLQGIQEPLRERYPVDDSVDTKGIDSWLSVWSNGLLLEYIEGDVKSEKAFFAIQSLHYCAAVRYVNVGGYSVEGGGERFLPLDSPFANLPDSPHPPLFAAIFRRSSGVKVLECHAFVCTNSKAANALVRSCFHAYADSVYLKMDESKMPGLKAIKEKDSSGSTTPRSEQEQINNYEDDRSERDQFRWSERVIGQQAWQKRQQVGEYETASISSSLAARYKRKEPKRRAHSDHDANQGVLVPFPNDLESSYSRKRAGSDVDLSSAIMREGYRFSPPPSYHSMGLMPPMGPMMGPPMGPQIGPMMGPPMGSQIGPMMGSSMGSQIRPMMGSPMGLPIGPMMGLPMGLPIGPMMGPPIGPQMGPMIGPPMGPFESPFGPIPPPHMMPTSMGPPPMMRPPMDPRRESMSPRLAPLELMNSKRTELAENRESMDATIPMDPRMGPIGPMGPMDPRMRPMEPMDPRIGPIDPRMGTMDRRMGPIDPRIGQIDSIMGTMGSMPLMMPPPFIGQQFPPCNRRSPVDSGPIITGPESVYGTMPRTTRSGACEEPVYTSGAMHPLVLPQSSYQPTLYPADRYDAYYDAYTGRRSKTSPKSKQKNPNSNRNSRRNVSNRDDEAANSFWDTYESGIYRKPHLNEKAFGSSIRDERNGTLTREIKIEKFRDDRPDSPPVDYNYEDDIRRETVKEHRVETDMNELRIHNDDDDDDKRGEREKKHMTNLY